MRTPSSAGFTLLEILVALVVFGLVMIGLTQGVQFGLHARAMQARTVEARSGLETTDRVLRNLVEQMDPGSTDRPAAVVGTEHSLSFVTTLPTEESPPVDAALLVDGAHRLLLRWTPRLHAVRYGPSPRPTDSLLVDNVDRVDFAYWELPADRAGQWVSTWHGSPLPILVRIRIVFRAPDRRRWPEMIVAPMRQPSRT